MIKSFFTDRYTALDVETQIGDRVLFTMQQVHGSHVSVVDKNSLHVSIKTDALISCEHGVALCVVVADCNPILCWDEHLGVIAAVHAGRIGSYEGILQKTLMRMQKEFICKPWNIHVSIGPSIRSCCYEVGNEVIHGFEEFTHDKDGKIYLDLLKLNLKQAKDAGVLEKNIAYSPVCTHCDANYFSYRREKTTKRFCGVIYQ
ncbi:MAG: polyphenol oxidase family protein [Sulfurospirillum sp.]|nr:polyphenol oxidase family protein [Sulfurospirillum sp.]